MIKTTIQRSVQHAILMDAEEVRSVASYLSSKYRAVEFTLNCNDGSTVTTNDMDDVLNFENLSHRRIESMKMSFYDDPRTEDGGEVVIGSLIASALFVVRGSDDAKELQIANELTQRIREMRPWYSWIRRLNPPTILVGGMVIAMTLWGIWAAIAGQRSEAGSTELPTAVVVGVLLPSIAAVVALIIYSDIGWNWLFPRVFFAIGRQIRELERRAKWRRWIFGGLLITILLGLLIEGLGKVIFR